VEWSSRGHVKPQNNLSYKHWELFYLSQQQIRNSQKFFWVELLGSEQLLSFFLFYYEFLGQHPGFSTSLLVDWPFLTRPVGENRVCQLPLAHRAYD